jgi:hypothetical protein
MYPQNRYRLTLFGLRHLGNVQGLGNNYAFVGVPGDMIFGDPTFSCPYYKLTPDISNNNDTAVEPGADTTITGSVSFVGNTDAGVHNWLVRQWKQPAGGVKVHERDYNYASAFSPSQTYERRDIPLSIPYTDAPGTKYCFITYVQKPDIFKTDANWAQSGEVCTVVGIKPKVQVLGNDLAAAGVIAASQPTLRDGKYYGSWGEFANFSNGNVKNGNYASHSALGGGGMSSKCGVPQWYKLTFANNGACASGMVNDAALGSFGATASNSASLISEIRSRMKPATIASSITDSTFKGGTPSDGSDDVQAVYVAGTANITGDIQPALYPKQNIIIARDGINIAPNVKTINAWLLVENGTINTCNSGAALYVVNGCRDQLVVNGPIAAKAMKLRRTTEPTAADPGKPAERFNLRADAFVWSYGGGGAANANAVARTVQVKELPPRF